MNFEEKMEAMGFDWKITSSDSGFLAILVDKLNGHRTVVSKVQGIPSRHGAQEILGLMAHKCRLSQRKPKTSRSLDPGH